MKGHRVVVTGLGAVTPVGLDVASSWAAITQGVSGAAPITAFDADAFTTRFSCSVKDFSADGYIPAKDAKRMDPFIQFGMVAGIQALRDSGFEVTDENCQRVGCAIGSGIGGIGSIERSNEVINTTGPRKMSPFFVPGAIINMISGNLSVMYNMRGPNLAVVTACTTGTHNIGLGARLIASGDADAMLVGGAEMATTPVGLGGFAAARALSTRNDDPQAASRPWDADRDGFVLGDGAAVLLLGIPRYSASPWRRDLCRGYRVWHERRCVSHDIATRGRTRCGYLDGQCFGRRGFESRGGGVHQRPRHFDLGW